MKWTEFSNREAALASACRELMYQYGVGLAFLATTRADGGPRVHPMCPLIDDAGLFAFLVPSPKRADLLRDGRYAMHSFPAEQSEDAFYLTGIARPSNEPSLRTTLQGQFMRERRLAALASDFEQQMLFEFDIERCLYTKTTGHGDPAPRHTVWRETTTR
jgi:hypothetical protein